MVSLEIWREFSESLLNILNINTTRKNIHAVKVKIETYIEAIYSSSH